MATYPDAEQVIAAAVVDRGTNIDRGPTPPIDNDTLEHAADIYKTVFKETGVRSMHETMAGSGEPIDEKKSKKVIEASVGWEINKSSGIVDRSTEEQTRLDDIQTAEEITRDFLTNQYDGLTDPEKDIVISGIKSAIENWPEAKNLFDTITDPVVQKKLLEEWAKDPRFSDKLRELYDEIYSDASIPTENVREAQDALERAENHKTETEKAETTAIARMNTAATEQAKFSDKGPSGSDSKQEQLDKLVAELSDQTKYPPNYAEDIQLQIQDLKQQYSNLSEQANNASKSKDFAVSKTLTESARELFTRTGGIDELQRELLDYRRKISIKNALESEKDSLEAEKLESEEAKELASKEKDDALVGESLARIAFDESKIARKEQEEKYVLRVQEIYTEAMQKVVLDQVQRGEELYTEKIAALRKGETDPVSLAYLDQLEKRWVIPSRDKEAKKPNNAKINSDFDAIFLKEGSSLSWTYDKAGVPTAFDITLTKEGLTYVDPSTGSTETIPGDARSLLVADMIREGGITDPQKIIDKLKDTEYMDKHATQSVVELVSRKIQSGSLTPADLEKIRYASWGEGVIEAAVSADKGRKEVYDQLKKDGIIKNTLWESVKDINKSKTTLWLLLILFAGPSLLAVPLILKSMKNKH
jgi:hypothetical protein